MNSFAITSMLPSQARMASIATVIVLLTMLSAPFAFVAMAAGAPTGSGAIDQKPMCYAAGVGCRPGPSLEIALFAPRH